MVLILDYLLHHDNSYASKICVDISNSVLEGNNNIGGFTGKVINSKINDSILNSKLDIFQFKYRLFFWILK